MKIHANARLTLHARREIVELMVVGFPVTEIAAQYNVSGQTVYNWWGRWRREGNAGLSDRSSRPHSCPHQTARKDERRIVTLRQTAKLGPARIAGIVKIAPSTVYRVLCRRGLNRLAWMHRPTGRVVRRIHTSRPGELVHIDAKRLGRIPACGGWRVHGRQASMRHVGGGYDHVHSAIDAYSRVAYSEILPAEDRPCCVGFLERAHLWFAMHGITIERVLTDNGNGYRSNAWRELCAELGIAHTRTRPYTPRTNGKVERFNRTLADVLRSVHPGFAPGIPPDTTPEMGLTLLGHLLRLAGRNGPLLGLRSRVGDARELSVGHRPHEAQPWSTTRLPRPSPCKPSPAAHRATSMHHHRTAPVRVPRSQSSTIPALVRSRSGQ